MNLDDAIDQAIAAAITHFAMHQALKRQAVSHETLDQYITDGLQKNAFEPQSTHAQAAQVLEDIRKAAGAEIILTRAEEVKSQMAMAEQNSVPAQQGTPLTPQAVEPSTQTQTGISRSHVTSPAHNYVPPPAQNSGGIQWSIIALGCLVFLLSSVILPFFMDSTVAVVFALVLASGFSAIRATRRKVLHAILTPVAYYAASLLLLMVMSIFAGA